MNDSPAFQRCAAEAAGLYKAMSAAPIQDSKRNYVGEQHRIVTRALALRLALERQDPTVRHQPWAAPRVATHEERPPAAACVHEEAARARATPMERGEVTPYSALQSACLLLAALFERTPFSGARRSEAGGGGVLLPGSASQLIPPLSHRPQTLISGSVCLPTSQR